MTMQVSFWQYQCYQTHMLNWQTHYHMHTMALGCLQWLPGTISKKKYLRKQQIVNKRQNHLPVIRVHIKNRKQPNASIFGAKLEVHSVIKLKYGWPLKIKPV